VAARGDALVRAGIWRHLLKSGDVVDVDVTSHALLFNGRRAELVVAQNVSERETAQQALAERTQIPALMADIGVALNRRASIGGCLRSCAESLAAYLEADFVAIWTIDRPAATLVRRAVAGRHVAADSVPSRVAMGSPGVGRIAQDRRPHFTNDLAEDGDDQTWAARHGFVAFAGYPLTIRDRVVGVLEVLAHHKLSDAVMTALGAVADIVALGIERHLAEEMAARLAAIVEDSDDAIYSLAPDGVIVSWNRAAQRMYGYAAAEAIGSSIEIVIPRDRVPEVRQLIQTVAGGEHVRQHETIRRRKDESLVPESLTMSPVRDASGHVIGCAAIARDVTERRALEQQYRQAQKMEAVGQLAGGVAHDFNNVLTAILGYANFMLEDLEPDHPVRADVGEIVKAGESAASLTRQLLAFSRRQILEPRVIDLNGIVTRMAALVRRLIGEDIMLVLELAPSVDPVRADPGQIEQIVMNLAVNARDAMLLGGTLTIQTGNVDLDAAFVADHPGSTAGPSVMLSVADTGTGIDAETLSRIFEPFFTTKKRGEGTGLGLSTVYGIVKQSSGFIDVESTPGRGTRFTTYLPRTAATVDAVMEQAGRRALTGSETILVAEDRAEVRVVARAILERHGYTVLEAADGREALAVVRSYEAPIHLLLTDVVMPVMGGRDLVNELQRTHPHIPVLFASGYTNDAIVRHGMLEPGLAFIQKPFTPEGLLRKVRELIDA
jgi:PAS domain S-box-containing protein